jgi:hypothetical protein
MINIEVCASALQLLRVWENKGALICSRMRWVGRYQMGTVSVLGGTQWHSLGSSQPGVVGRSTLVLGIANVAWYVRIVRELPL